MVLNVTVKKGAGTLFTQCQLEEIAQSLCIQMPDSMRLVYYGQTAPLDTTLSWQPTNGIDDPVGKVKNYTDGNWNE